MKRPAAEPGNSCVATAQASKPGVTGSQLASAAVQIVLLALVRQAFG